MISGRSLGHESLFPLDSCGQNRRAHGSGAGTRFRGRLQVARLTVRRVVSWNCGTAFHAKSQPIADLSPDLLVVQETEARAFTDAVWIGKSPRKGLGVHAAVGQSVLMAPGYDPVHRWFAPTVWTRSRGTTEVLAVWAMNHRGDPERKAHGQTLRAFQAYAPWLASHPTVIIGDFNANAIWDLPRVPGTYHDTKRELEALGYVSVYHARSGEPHGSESEPTFYFYRHEGKPYHIDYCYLPAVWLPRVRAFQIGRYSEWGALSDHMPLIPDLELDG
jgi:hypothetical protein